MRTFQPIDSSSLERVEGDLAARGPAAAPALILFRLAIAGKRVRDLHEAVLTPDQIVWPESAVLRHVPRPRVGIRLFPGSDAVVYFSGDCGAWIARRARDVRRGEPFFPNSAFLDFANALDCEKISRRSLRVHAAIELFRRLAA